MDKKIAVVTSSRADYSALTPLIEALENDSDIEFRLIVTGTHLSEEQGMTRDAIIADGFTIHKEIKMHSDGDTEADICNSIAAGTQGFSEYLKDSPPDLLIVLGDRFELWSACMAAVIHKTPIAHIYGGEITRGAIDNPIRHSVSKMASYHFVSVKEHAQRVIQMGELPDTVFEIGALSLDSISKTELLNANELSEHSGIDFTEKVALMTYHPVTLDDYISAEDQVKEVLSALSKSDYKTLITMPNPDPAGRLIFNNIESWVNDHSENFHFVKSLGKQGYYSALQHADLMIGNSSSGLIETMAFNLPVVNIGDRQAGRLTPPNVVSCECREADILKAITKASSDEFISEFKNAPDPLGEPGAAERILKIIKDLNLSDKSRILKKEFYDLK